MASIISIILLAFLVQVNGQTPQQATELLETDAHMAPGDEEEQVQSETGEEEDEDEVDPVNLMALGEEEEEPESEIGEEEEQLEAEIGDEEDEAAPVRQLLDDAKLKRAPTAYISWFNDNRKSIKGKNIAEVAKKAGSMWKALSAANKKTYQDSAAKAKEQRQSYIAKVKDSKEFKAYADAKTAARKQKLKRKVKSAVKAIAKDKNLKRPPSAYMSWLSDNRKTIKGKNVAEIGKKAGSMWKTLSAGSKKTYEDKAAKAKKAYDDFVASSKGAAALKAYKDAVAKAKAPLSATADKAKAKAKAAKEKLAARKKALKEKLAAKKAAKKAAKAAKKAKKLIEIMPDVISVPAGALIGVLLGSGVALAVLQLRRSISIPAEEPLLA